MADNWKTIQAGGITLAHLWIQNKETKWEANSLAGCEVSLSSLISGNGNHHSPAGHPAGGVHLLRTDDANLEQWAVLASEECAITINGIPLLLGIRSLKDRDEIRWSQNGSAFFSSEELAAVVNLPSEDRKIVCPRCKQEIASKTPAVRCPRCGIWHHQSEEFPCYTYAEHCATCSRKTSLDSGFDWIPEDM